LIFLDFVFFKLGQVDDDACFQSLMLMVVALRQTPEWKLVVPMTDSGGVRAFTTHPGFVGEGSGVG